MSNHLKAGNFFCQQLVLPHRDLTLIVAELDGMQRRFPQIFDKLNIVIDFSEVKFGDDSIEDFVRDTKQCIEGLGHQVVGSLGIKAGIATACGIKPVKQRIESSATSLMAGHTKREEEQPKPQEAVEKPTPKVVSVDTLIIEEPVRSGQSVYAEGKNLVIIGDVKRGAEIAADFSVTVFGKLQGRVHAGVKGSKTSTIMSTNFDPEVVSINGTFIGNQDIDSANLETSCLVQLKADQNKIIIHANHTAEPRR
ncbi:septum site-determining protein MinC [Vibrio coralliirubri]|uniref:septum site-determining protein MinC n=1 Tax=Vibrio coralliirubri TaxID=1516159 RepID=UPI0022852A7E|nr:septum site-determining protein MinC [Vibrio coralliirubri]MCY9861037.1 septum site-determining protein MinC [Vibrio coralliirubri]